MNVCVCTLCIHLALTVKLLYRKLYKFPLLSVFKWMCTHLSPAGFHGVRLWISSRVYQFQEFPLQIYFGPFIWF